MPPYSPNLNPIENLWFLLKEAIYKLCPDLLTMTNVDTASRTWESIKDKVLRQLALTMPHRMEAVEKADGWYSKY